MPLTYRRLIHSHSHSDAELILSDFTDDNFEEPQPKNTFKKAVKTTVTMQDLTGSTDIYVIVEFVFDEGKKRRR